MFFHNDSTWKSSARPWTCSASAVHPVNAKQPMAQPYMYEEVLSATINNLLSPHLPELGRRWGIVWKEKVATQCELGKM